MKMLINANKGSNCIPPMNNVGELIYDDVEKCELHNKYFSEISKIEDDNIPLPAFPNRTENTINDIIVTENEITDVIQILDPKKGYWTR